MSTIRITVSILKKDSLPGSPKLADAEVHFTSGELEGLTLSGFAVWQAKSDSGQNVTFSSSHFRVHGARRHFSMLRWIAKREAQERLADAVWRASDDTASSQMNTVRRSGGSSTDEGIAGPSVVGKPRSHVRTSPMRRPATFFNSTRNRASVHSKEPS